MKVYILSFTLAILLSIKLQNSQAQSPTSEDQWITQWKGKQFPDFSTRDLKGNLVSKTSILGKYVVINFWFVRCKPCVNEIPELNRLVEKYSSESILFLAPSFDSQELLQKFSDEKPFKYEILSNSEELNKAFEVYAYPTHVILDNQGIVKEILVGGPDIFNRLDMAIRKYTSSKDIR